MSKSVGNGNLSGFVLGLTLGLIWTPCAGPVLGSILTLIATQGNVGSAGILLTAYAIGAGIPMLIIAYGGQYITTRVRIISRYTTILQQVFGVLIIALAIAMFFQFDTQIQAWLTQHYNFGNVEQGILSRLQ
jgi:cytochrome c biogenesis protein CcdA